MKKVVKILIEIVAAVIYIVVILPCQIVVRIHEDYKWKKICDQIKNSRVEPVEELPNN